MPACPSCGSSNPSEFRFCGACGVALDLVSCPACGSSNPAAQPFCGRCGGRLRADPPPRADRAERRLATVLFADVVGFTALAEASDPEALASTVEAALRRMTDVVVSHGGTIDKYMGDALMALFGVPTAHGDDAERAVAAALQMRDSGGDLRFSIGVNTGEVMVTPVIDGGAVTVIGDAVNVASRLENAAGAGEILVGPLTAELVADRFQLRERAPTVLRGKSTSIAVFEVLARRVAGADDGSAAPLVGREAELAFLRSRCRRAAECSRAQLIIVTGEAGVGKTRLAAELGAAVSGECSVVRAACPGYGALVGSRLSLELASQLATGSGAAVAEPETAGPAFDDRGIWRLRRLIADRAADRPVLIVIDDLHNAAEPDLDPLVQLLARITDLPVTVVLAGRAQPSAWLGRFPAASALRLDPLSPADALTLAAHHLGGHGLGSDAAGDLAVQSDGNPLHLRELARLLSSSNGSAARGGPPGATEHPPLPATLQGVLAARLDALPAEDRAALHSVAIFTDGATLAEIEALAGLPVQRSLDRLVGLGLLRQHDARFLVGDPLLREVAYEQLPHARRGALHREAARVASTAQGRARHLGQAARFLPADAGLRAEAGAELAATGIGLLESSRLRDGIVLLRRAVELGFADAATLLRLAEAENDLGVERAATFEVLDRIDCAGDPRLEAAVLQARGNALRGVDPQASEATLTEVIERWTRLEDAGKRAWALANRGMTRFDMGRIAEAADDHEAALAIFRDIGDRGGAAAAGQTLALARPDDPRIPAWLADGLALADETGDLTQQRNALIPLAWSFFLRDHLGGAECTSPAVAHATRLAAVSAELGDGTFESQGHAILAVLDRLTGRVDSAAEKVARARRALAGAGGYSAPFVEAAGAMVRLAAGEAGVALPAALSDVGPIALVAETMTIEGLLLAGDTEAATARIDGWSSEPALARSPLFTRLVGLASGAALVLAGRCDEAEAALVRARDAARSLGALPSEATATALLAEMRVRSGQLDEARSLMATITGDPGGVAGAMGDRVRALLGDQAAATRLRAAVVALAVPGLAIDEAANGS